MVGHRLISPGDENALLPEETPAFASSVPKVRRASGAARIVARQLLKGLGQPECALPRGSGGAPTWPAGVVGSLAHDSRVAVAGFLDHHDVQINFADRKAIVRNGRVVELRFCIAAHLLALAFLPGLR